MLPAHELAVHARLSGCAAVTVIRILIVDRMGNEMEPDPQGNMLPAIFPRYTSPERVRVVLNLSLLTRPESSTSHGPAAHFGVASHDSAHLWRPPLREPAPLTFLRLTAHGTCKRAAEMGGVTVRTARTADSAERLPPRTAATRYW